MSRTELEEIVKNGLCRLGMRIEPDALNRLTLLSQGLPHYTHLLALYSVRQALDYQSDRIAASDVVSAIKTALTQAQQSTRSVYHTATRSTRRENLHAKVLLACALAKTDDLGYFAPADVREPLTTIMKKRYEIPSFVRHLNLFCGNVRGPVLQKSGVPHGYRYRFMNPLLQPFVMMQGMVDGLVTESVTESRTT